MKKYWKPGMLNLESRTQEMKDGYVVPKALENEDPRALQVENIADEFGSMIPTITLNQALKDSILSQELIDNTEIETKKNTELVTREDLLTRLVSFDETTINDIAAIRSFAKDIKEYFLYKYRDDVAKKKAKA